MTMPTTVTLPNVRYGSSFLDKKYKKYAELGEVVMDKITGEILVKRKADGKLISFVQNDKYLHDIMIELRILMKNNTDWTFPSTNESWFVSSDFNVTDITGTTADILTNYELEFPNTSLDEKNRFEFYVSKESNGFYMRPISRDTDKNIIEYLTNLYNITFQTYSGINESFAAEKEKFANADYYGSNAEVTFSITVAGTSNATSKQQTFSGSSYIRINEETFVRFPENYDYAFDEITSIKVTINQITFSKFDMVNQYMKSETNFDKTMYNKLIAPDNAAIIEHVNVMEFVDNGNTIPSNDNIVTIALLDTAFVLEYVGKVDKLAGSAGYIPSVTRPTSDLWTINNAWGEIVRIVRASGQTGPTEHETDMDALEKYIYNTEGISTNFTFNPDDLTDIYIKDVSDSE